MLYRHKDGTFSWSMPGAEEGIKKDRMTRREGLAYIRSLPGIPDDIRKKLLTERGEGFVIT